MILQMGKTAFWFNGTKLATRDPRLATRGAFSSP